MSLRSSGGCAFGLLAVILPLLIVGAQGCGGDSGDAQPLRRPVFISEANAICLEAIEKGVEESKGLTGEDGGDPAGEAEAVIEDLVSPVKEMTEELEELGAPSGDEGEVSAIIGAFEEGIASLEDGFAGSESLSAFSTANQLATDYGLRDCTV